MAILVTLSLLLKTDRKTLLGGFKFFEKLIAKDFRTCFLQKWHALSMR